MVMLQKAVFSTGEATSVSKLHEKRHIGQVMDTRFYEGDFLAGKNSELEYVRSPFYGLAKREQLNAEQAGALVDDVSRAIG